ncbi:hypothetical protein [Actinacidiphila sp. ITFR-21]|uniref:hypothetical protein n=1 Tax=Actinacidiphila sp. ITFR-21 TaxID=3075199 RepID=UPI00288C35F1|nr:hypothetical protein [Streptomyces sp. ITFR-21]WNI17219.1 hypothetical protein RLT57_18000 [Streptomyces sp. ITFR-21]
MGPFDRCERQAAVVIADRMAEPDVRERLVDRGTTGRIGFEPFLRQVRGVTAVAVFSAHRDALDLPPARVAATALAVLRDTRPPDTLFTVLPADLGGSASLVADPRVLAAGRAAGPAPVGTARPDRAQRSRRRRDLPDEAHVIGPVRGPDRPFDEAALTTRRDRPPGPPAS